MYKKYKKMYKYKNVQIYKIQNDSYNVTNLIINEI